MKANFFNQIANLKLNFIASLYKHIYRRELNYLTSVSDHLDMVGVELKATITQTRKVNGDILQERIKNTIGLKSQRR